MLAVHALRKSFGAVEVLRDVAFSAEAGEFICLLGPSGCGKSTLLRCIAGLETVTAGRIEIDGQDMTDVPPADRGLAMVFQNYALYPHLSVRKNMAFGLALQRMPRAEIDRRVAEAARILSIDHLLDRRPKALSGGQRQRVAIGRAIVRDPRIFLFDEPLSNLDAALRTQTRQELARLHRDLGRTMIFVTHDQVEAMTLSTRVIVLNKGRVAQAGPPLDLYRRPADLFVAGFVGTPQMNFLKVADGKLCGRPLPPGQPRAVTAGFRPEHVHLDPEGVEARVTGVEQLGSETLVFTQAGAETLVLRGDGQMQARPGDALRLGFDLDQIHLFDAEGKRVETGQPAA